APDLPRLAFAAPRRRSSEPFGLLHPPRRYASLLDQASDDLAEAMHTTHVARHELEADPVIIVGVAHDAEDLERPSAARWRDLDDHLFTDLRPIRGQQKRPTFRDLGERRCSKIPFAATTPANLDQHRQAHVTT